MPADPLKFSEYFQNKSLMVFDDEVYHHNGKEYSSDEAFILFIMAFARYFQRLILCSRLLATSKSATYKIAPQKIKVCAFPYYKSIADLLAKAVVFIPRIWRIIKMNIEQWDVLWLTWPHPISLLLLIKARHARKCCFLVVRQNLKELMKQRYRGLQKVAAVFMVDFLEWQLKLWRKNLVIFTVGNEMYEKFRRHHRNVHPIEISLLTKNDLATSRSSFSRGQQNPLRLLFVGRLEPEKGLPFLLEALAICKMQNHHVHLDIVGSGVEEENLRQLAQKLELSERVSFHGYVAFGEPLFVYYRAADFLVLPSLSEGIPQVILEAMAFGVPIIATALPSIKGIIAHGENGWLVEPGSAAALARAIGELADNPTLADTLRQREVDNFYTHTMEFQQEKMLEALAKYLE